MKISSPLGVKPEWKEAEMKKRYQDTLYDLVTKGLLSDEPVPGALAINSYLGLHPDESEEPPSPE